MARIAIEITVGLVGSLKLGRRTHGFSHGSLANGEIKRTVLWLKGLLNLEPTPSVAGKDPRDPS